MNRTSIIAALVVLAAVVVWLVWPRSEADRSTTVASTAVQQEAEVAPRSAPATPAPRVAVASPAPQPETSGAAAASVDAGADPNLFGPLVSLGQGYALSEALQKNAAHADEYVDTLCARSAKLRENPPMNRPRTHDSDAAVFMAPLIDYEKPLDQPYGRLHVSDELKAHVAKGWPDWSQQITDADLAGLDFSWMQQLQQFDHWSLLTAGRLKDHPMKDFFNTPIPNYVSLMIWSKLRFALARRRHDHAQASAEVRHLADLIRSQGILIAEAVAVAIYKIDASSRQSAVTAGGDVSGWEAPDTDALDTERNTAFASMYFTYPGVKPETVRKAMGCIPAPCVALAEGAGANRAFGAYAGSDNLQLIGELARANGCEQAIFDRAAASNEVSAEAAWNFVGGELDGQIAKYLGPGR